MGGPTSSYAATSIDFRLIDPPKLPHPAKFAFMTVGIPSRQKMQEWKIRVLL
jgi:hypothetical protein